MWRDAYNSLHNTSSMVTDLPNIETNTAENSGSHAVCVPAEISTARREVTSIPRTVVLPHCSSAAMPSSPSLSVTGPMEKFLSGTSVEASDNGRPSRKRSCPPDSCLTQSSCMRWLQENHEKNKRQKANGEDDQWICTYCKEIYGQGAKRSFWVSCSNLECDKHMHYCCIPKTLSDKYPKPFLKFVRASDTDFYCAPCFTIHNPPN